MRVRFFSAVMVVLVAVIFDDAQALKLQPESDEQDNHHILFPPVEATGCKKLGAAVGPRGALDALHLTRLSLIGPKTAVCKHKPSLDAKQVTFHPNNNCQSSRFQGMFDAIRDSHH